MSFLNPKCMAIFIAAGLLSVEGVEIRPDYNFGVAQHCREMLLHDYAPELMQELDSGLALATTRVSCACYQELSLFDDVPVRMSSTAINPSQMTMLFQYFRISEQGEEQLVAEREQEVACVRRTGDHIEPMPLPAARREVVEHFMAR